MQEKHSASSLSLDNSRPNNGNSSRTEATPRLLSWLSLSLERLGSSGEEAVVRSSPSRFVHLAKNFETLQPQGLIGFPCTVGLFKEVLRKELMLGGLQGLKCHF